MSLAPEIPGDASFSDLVVTNRVHIFGSVEIDGTTLVTSLDAQTVNVYGTAQSTSTATGALVVAGGVGIAKNLNVGGTVTGGQTTLSTLVVVGNSNVGFAGTSVNLGGTGSSVSVAGSGATLAFFGLTPASRYSTTGQTTNVILGTAVTASIDTKYSGYTVDDVVLALKAYGLLV